jgi:CRP-like cAMP-binding protein
MDTAAADREGFWHLLTAAEQDALSALGRTTAFTAGSTLCVEGEPATHLFVLTTGWVKILSVTRDGQEQVLALRGHGDVVGEIAGETSGSRTATVQAIGAVQSLIIGYEPFSQFLDTHRTANRVYRHAMIQRWNETATLLRNRSLTTGAQRLAALVLGLADRHGVPAVPSGALEIEMPLSQTELASLAGTSRATLTRALASWRRRGLIRTGHRHITIVDLKGLRKLSGRQD